MSGDDHDPGQSSASVGISSLPSFVMSENNTYVTSVGQTVYLYCGVNNLGDRQVCNIFFSIFIFINIHIDLKS